MEDYTNMTRNHLGYSNDGFEKEENTNKQKEKRDSYKDAGLDSVTSDHEVAGDNGFDRNDQSSDDKKFTDSMPTDSPVLESVEKSAKELKASKAETKKKHDENLAKTEKPVHAKVTEHETKSGKSEMGEREKNEKMTEEMVKLHEKLGDKPLEAPSKEEVKKISKEMQKEYGINNGITGYGQIDDHIVVYIEHYDVIKNLPERYQDVRVEYVVTGRIKALDA